MLKCATRDRTTRQTSGTRVRLATTPFLVAGIVASLIVCFTFTARSAAPAAATPQVRGKLPPFLDVFLARNEPKIVTHHVQWATPLGTGKGVLARREPQPAIPVADAPFLSLLSAGLHQTERYPAVLVIPGQGLHPWHTRVARELAEIGYVALVLEAAAPLPAPMPATGAGDAVAQQRVLAELVSAVRWLRRREDVYPDRVGLIGWSGGGYWGTVLAAATGLQACVNCNGPAPDDPVLLTELRHTAVMHISSGIAQSPEHLQQRRAFQAALQGTGIEHQFIDIDNATAGFMFPENAAAYRFDDAERAWFEIYEFLGKHVEDAHIKILLRERNLSEGAPQAPVSTIAELMRAVNTPEGVRGSLAQALRNEPDSPKAWSTVTARAKLLADAADLLQRRQPPRGTAAHWQKQIAEYRSAALAIAEAAAKADYSAAGAGLRRLSASCGNCHRDHR